MQQFVDEIQVTMDGREAGQEYRATNRVRASHALHTLPA
jgi:hypothetical protein